MKINKKKYLNNLISIFEKNKNIIINEISEIKSNDINSLRKKIKKYKYKMKVIKNKITLFAINKSEIAINKKEISKNIKNSIILVYGNEKNFLYIIKNLLNFSINKKFKIKIIYNESEKIKTNIFNKLIRFNSEKDINISLLFQIKAVKIKLINCFYYKLKILIKLFKLKN